MSDELYTAISCCVCFLGFTAGIVFWTFFCKLIFADR